MKMIKRIDRAITAAEDWIDFSDGGAAAGVGLLLLLLVSGWLFLHMVAA